MAAFAGAQAGRSHTAREQNRPAGNEDRANMSVTWYVGRFYSSLGEIVKAASVQRVAQVHSGAPAAALGPGGTKCVLNTCNTSAEHISFVWSGALVPPCPWQMLLLQLRRPTEGYLAASSRQEPQRLTILLNILCNHFGVPYGALRRGSDFPCLEGC